MHDSLDELEQQQNITRTWKTMKINRLQRRRACVPSHAQPLSDGSGRAMVMVGAADHAAPQAQPAQRADGALRRRAARLAAPLERQQPLRRRRLHLDGIVLRPPSAERQRQMLAEASRVPERAQCMVTCKT
uniref:Uncharacterized protein n=1 Tax=Oryza brachyantha TaxID=4533 RepID=J3LGB0_ORYBR